MALPTDLIIYAIRATETPEEAADLIFHYERIRDMVARRDKKLVEIRQTAERLTREAKDTVICSHDVLKRHWDPSGGSDATMECLVCGDEVVEKPYRHS